MFISNLLLKCIIGDFSIKWFNCVCVGGGAVDTKTSDVACSFNFDNIFLHVFLRLKRFIVSLVEILSFTFGSVCELLLCEYETEFKKNTLTFSNILVRVCVFLKSNSPGSMRLLFISC